MNIKSHAAKGLAYFLPASAGKAGIQGRSELVLLLGVVTLLLVYSGRRQRNARDQLFDGSGDLYGTEFSARFGH